MFSVAAAADVVVDAAAVAAAVVVVVDATAAAVVVVVFGVAAVVVIDSATAALSLWSGGEGRGEEDAGNCDCAATESVAATGFAAAVPERDGGEGENRADGVVDAVTASSVSAAAAAAAEFA